jgi:acyl carrier protein
MIEAGPVREKLRKFLAVEVFAGRDAATIGDDDDLVSMGLDSLSVLRLVLFLETEIGVDLDGEDVLGDKLSTIRRIADHCAASSDAS